MQVIALAGIAVIAKMNGRSIDKAMDRAVDKIRKRLDREPATVSGQSNPYLGTPWAHLWKPDPTQSETEVKDNGG